MILGVVRELGLEIDDNIPDVLASLLESFGESRVAVIAVCLPLRKFFLRGLDDGVLARTDIDAGLLGRVRSVLVGQPEIANSWA